ncbi:regulated by snt2 1 [Fusarium bulbicola]|nr:regulated by snt2 1 [Fusarium bulbicola]
MTPQQTRYITSHSGDMKCKMRKEGLMVLQNDTKMRKEGLIMTQNNTIMPLRVLIQNKKMKEFRGDPSLNWEQMTKDEKDVDAPSSLAPKVTGRLGRDKARLDEPAIGARNDVTFDACVDNAVRDVDSTDGHVSDSGNGNDIADDHNRGH